MLISLTFLLALGSSILQAQPIEPQRNDAINTTTPLTFRPNASSTTSLLDDNLNSSPNINMSSTSSMRSIPTSLSSSSAIHQESATSTASFPPSPSGATLVQFQPCKGTEATVPMFVNDLWADGSDSKATRAFVITHGAARDIKNSFEELYEIVKGTGDGVLVAPAFYIRNDKEERFKPNWYQEETNLAWLDPDKTLGGSDAILPSSGGKYDATQSSCSTYSVYDSLISTFADEKKYPQMEEVVFAGHSEGAATTLRYSVVAQNSPKGITIKFAAANSPSFPYFSENRPLSYQQKYETEYNSWPYGFEEKLSPYVKVRIGSMNASTLFSKWASVDVRTLTGDRDTFQKYPFGDISPEACIQGPSRRDRNYAYWAYRVLLAGVEDDVSDIKDYYGYDNLTTLEGGVKSLNVKNFAAQQCNVEGVGHVGKKMWQSNCGMSALLDSKMKGGAPPRRPGPTPICSHP